MAGEAVLRVLEAAVRALDAARVPHAVIGGAALPAWGRIRATADADVLVVPQRTGPSGGEVLTRIVGALREAGFAHMDRADRRRIGDREVLHFWFPIPEYSLSVRLDLLVSESAEERGIIERAVLRKVDGIEVRVACCEDLIFLKLASGRPVDLADARDLFSLNRAQLDLDGMRTMAADRGLARELAELLVDATGEGA